MKLIIALTLFSSVALAQENELPADYIRLMADYGARINKCDELATYPLLTEPLEGLALSEAQAARLLYLYQPLAEARCSEKEYGQLKAWAEHHIKHPDKKLSDIAQSLTELLDESAGNELRQLYEDKNPQWLKQVVRDQELLNRPYDAEQVMRQLFPAWQLDLNKPVWKQ